jgi:hypothetical protein
LNPRKISRKGSKGNLSGLSQQRKKLQNLQLSNKNYDNILLRSFDRAAQVNRSSDSPTSHFDLEKANEKLRKELE